jgi:exopolysaccharide biosynthesis polyprenyl glycosylphosphotransferase
MKTTLKEKKALVVVSDSMAMAISFVVAILLGHQAHFTFGLPFDYLAGFATLSLTALLFFVLFDLYSPHKISQRFLQQAIPLGTGLLAGSILSAVVFFFLRNTVPRAVFIIFYVSAFTFILLFRYIINERMVASIKWKAILVGNGKRSAEMAQLIHSRPYLRTTIEGYISQGDERRVTDNQLPCLGNNIDDLVSIVVERGIDQVIVAEITLDDTLLKLLLECMQKKIKVADFRKVIEEITGKIPIDHLNDNWFILALSTSDKRYFWYTKRFFDILLSCIGICLALPLFPFAALLVKLDSQGPIFYSQMRMGRGSKPFRAWKLRTMTDGADRNNVHWTTNNDSRITRVGRIIRKTRLDEVPQLINILKGEMSLIGPRPEALSLVEMYTREISYYPERHLAAPGITGWAQINYPYGNSIEDTRQKLMYDFYYIKNRCFTLDLLIFLKTIKIVLTGRGAM